MPDDRKKTKFEGTPSPSPDSNGKLQLSQVATLKKLTSKDTLWAVLLKQCDGDPVKLGKLIVDANAGRTVEKAWAMPRAARVAAGLEPATA